jgi:hypothetical protein
MLTSGHVFWAPAKHLGTNEIFGHQHSILGTNKPTQHFGANTTFGHQHNILGTNLTFALQLTNFIENLLRVGRSLDFPCGHRQISRTNC